MSLRGDDSSPASSGSVRLIRAYAGWIALVTCVSAAGALLLSSHHRVTYTSQARVSVQPRVYPNGAPQVPAMGTEREIAQSQLIAQMAASALHVPVASISKGLTVTVPVDTDVLTFSYSARTAAQAQRAAGAFATAYIDYRNSENFKRISGQSQAGDLQGPPSASMISAASLPTHPSKANYPLNLAVGILVGLTLGVGSAIGWDRVSDRIRGTVDLETQTGLPVVAVIPTTPNVLRGRGQRVVMTAIPRSSVAEAYRYLRARVLQAATHDRVRSVLVTSGVEREGKTTTAVNLAAALAMSGKQVVLVGADLRRPHLHDVFDGDNSIGLTSVLANGIDVDVALQSTKIDGLRLLAAGPLAADPGALLESSDLASVLDQLRELADFVVLDSAPLLTVADTVPLMELADMTLLVVDARRSTHRRVSSAVAAMAQARGKLVAAVLTKANSRATELPLYASENYRGSRRRVVSLRAKAGG